MNRRRNICQSAAFALMGTSLLGSLMAAPPAVRTHSVFSVKPDHTGTLWNGKPFLVAGLRVSNALVSDAKTQELIERLKARVGPVGFVRQA
jgi:hypothetical protein